MDDIGPRDRPVPVRDYVEILGNLRTGSHVLLLLGDFLLRDGQTAAKRLFVHPMKRNARQADISITTPDIRVDTPEPDLEYAPSSGSIGDSRHNPLQSE